MRGIIFLTFILFNFYAIGQTKYDHLINLTRQYSYKNELLSRNSSQTYKVLDSLKLLILNDSVNISFTKHQLLEFSYLFLKKRALGLRDFSDENIYLSNMALWPGEIVTFCLNKILNYDPNNVLSIKHFLNYRVDYVCVKILEKYECKIDKCINKRFASKFKKFTCE